MHRKQHKKVNSTVVIVDTRVHKLSRTLDATSKFNTPDLKQGKCNNYAENTGHHHIKFSHPHNLAPKICEPHMDESKHKWNSLKLFQFDKKSRKKCIKVKSVQKKIFLHITQNCLVWDVMVKKPWN